MDPRACVVITDTGDWPGWLLAWQRRDGAWRGLCRYRSPHMGYLLNREHWVPAASLRPR